MRRAGKSFGTEYNILRGSDLVCGNGSCTAAAVTAAAVALSQGRSNEEISLLGAIFTQLGDTLITIAAANNSCGTPEN